MMAIKEIRTVGLIGGGVIGAGWAARLLLNGRSVVLYDPDPEVERKVAAVLENARRAQARLTLAPPVEGAGLRFAKSLEEAVEGVDFIQESLPEREDLKRKILARVGALAGPEIVIGSSTSGLLPSRLQEDLRHPGRLVVGHPFNPVYLLPLVEVCGGARTAPDTCARAAAFYREIGMQPLLVRKEIDGFIADRLLEAVWREALWLVSDGVATTSEIDDAIRYGAGLRWSFMGTFLIYRLAGGEAGMRHFLEQFGPALKLPWTGLEAPELTDRLIETIAEQSDDQAGGKSIRDLERLRDDCLVAVLQGLRGQGYAAGATLNAHEEQLYEAAHTEVMSDDAALDAPLRLHGARVLPDWIDYNGHMTESRYLQVFGDSSDALFRYVGIDAGYHAAGKSYYTVETHIMNLREVAAEEPLRVTTQVLGLDEKRLHIFHGLYATRGERLLATAEQMLLHVDTKAGRACPAAPAVLARLTRIAEAHARLPRPDGAGRHIGQKRG
ncbi:MAG: carnitine 3-dehydrogenase [Kiloniellales bacterium]